MLLHSNIHTDTADESEYTRDRDAAAKLASQASVTSMLEPLSQKLAEIEAERDQLRVELSGTRAHLRRLERLERLDTPRPYTHTAHT